MSWGGGGDHARQASVAPGHRPDTSDVPRPAGYIQDNGSGRAGVEEPLLSRAPDLPEVSRGRSSRSGRASGLVSTHTGGALVRGRHGLAVRQRGGGRTRCPARCSLRSKPRQIASHGCPFGCVHSHAAQTAKDTARRLRRGCAASSVRRNARSAGVIGRPRYVSNASTPRERSRARDRTRVPRWRLSHRHAPPAPGRHRPPADRRPRSAAGADAPAASSPASPPSATSETDHGRVACARARTPGRHRPGVRRAVRRRLRKTNSQPENGIRGQHLATEAPEPIDALAEIDGLDAHEDAHLGRELDHRSRPHAPCVSVTRSVTVTPVTSMRRRRPRRPSRSITRGREDRRPRGGELDEGGRRDAPSPPRPAAS